MGFKLFTVTGLSLLGRRQDSRSGIFGYVGIMHMMTTNNDPVTLRNDLKKLSHDVYRQEHSPGPTDPKD